MALVTSSLVSRRAASRSTGTCQDRMASRTRRRASAGVAGPVASRTRHPRRTSRSGRTWRSCRSAVRGGAIVVIGFLPNRLTQVLMQLALQDIGQLTDIDIRGRIPAFAAARRRPSRHCGYLHPRWGVQVSAILAASWRVTSVVTPASREGRADDEPVTLGLPAPEGSAVTGSSEAGA